MRRFKIKLQNQENIAALIGAAEKLNGDVDMVCGRYTVDARSLLGIMSIDLNRECFIVVHNDDGVAEFREKIKKFTLSEEQE